MERRYQLAPQEEQRLRKYFGVGWLCDTRDLGEGAEDRRLLAMGLLRIRESSGKTPDTSSYFELTATGALLAARLHTTRYGPHDTLQASLAAHCRSHGMMAWEAPAFCGGAPSA